MRGEVHFVPFRSVPFRSVPFTRSPRVRVKPPLLGSASAVTSLDTSAKKNTFYPSDVASIPLAVNSSEHANTRIRHERARVHLKRSEQQILGWRAVSASASPWPFNG